MLRATTGVSRPKPQYQKPIPALYHRKGAPGSSNYKSGGSGVFDPRVGRTVPNPVTSPPKQTLPENGNSRPHYPATSSVAATSSKSSIDPADAEWEKLPVGNSSYSKKANHLIPFSTCSYRRPPVKTSFFRF